MTYYFKQTNNTDFRRKSRTTLPTKLDEDLVNYFNKTEQLKDYSYSKILRLRNITQILTNLEIKQQIEQNGSVLLKKQEKLFFFKFK